MPSRPQPRCSQTSQPWRTWACKRRCPPALGAAMVGPPAFDQRCDLAVAVLLPAASNSGAPRPGSLLAGRIRFDALAAEAAHQALRQDAEQRIREVEGSSPISSRRAMLSGAELVCSVESTRWPVSEASIAMRARSLVAHLADRSRPGRHAGRCASHWRRSSRCAGSSAPGAGLPA